MPERSADTFDEGADVLNNSAEHAGLAQELADQVEQQRAVAQDRAALRQQALDELETEGGGMVKGGSFAIDQRMNEIANRESAESDTSVESEDTSQAA